MELKYTSQFKRDLKKIQNNPNKIKKIKQVLRFLEQTGTVPVKYKPHKLIGNYEGCLECHIETDLLLIWIDERQKMIKLIRLGSHSELF